MTSIVLHHELGKRAWMLIAVLGIGALTSPIWLAPVLAPPRTLRYTELDVAGGRYFPVHATGPLHPGDAIPMEVAACNDGGRPLTIVITRNLVTDDPGGTTYFLGDVGGSWAPGCSTVLSLAHRIPEAVGPGHYHLEGTTRPAGAQAVEWRSATFEVAGSGGI